MKKEFPQTVSHDRFVELQQKAVLPMDIFLKTCCLGHCTGISFIDSTPVRACHIKREEQHKKNSIRCLRVWPLKGNAQWAGSLALSYI